MRDRCALRHAPSVRGKCANANHKGPVQSQMEGNEESLGSQRPGEGMQLVSDVSVSH